ncbi:MAG TPA: hypothetical protein VHX87_05845 [Galbitalea sp.]|nr:hypothetical protein [Galbitalea sp.]
MRGYWALVLGVIVLALGLVPMITYADPPASFGWTAYAPLTSATFSPPVAPTLWVCEVVAGVILISGWVGYRIGRRKVG